MDLLETKNITLIEETVSTLRDSQQTQINSTRTAHNNIFQLQTGEHNISNNSKIKDKPRE